MRPTTPDSNLHDLATRVADLIDHVLRTHHDLERRELPRLVRLVEKVARRHGGTHTDLVQLAGHVQNLADELESHLDREERVLFPYLMTLVSAARRRVPAATPSFYTLRNPIRIMSAEHAVEDELMAAIRSVADDYATPSHADEAWKTLLEWLAALDAELAQHVLLEDTVLFPLALELEERVGFAEKTR